MTRLSLNANAQAIGDSAFFLDTLRALKPTTLVVMDGLGLAEQAYNAIGVQSIVAHRAFGESNIHALMRPAQAIAQWKKEGAFHIFRYGANEPTPSKEFLDWEVECADRCRDAGIHRVLGNIGPATWQKSHIDLGLYDEYLYCLARHEGWHVAGWHEYSSVIFPLGAGGRDMHALFDRTQCQPDKWPTLSEVRTTRDNYHIFRTQLFTEREKVLGLSPHKKILTECFWDDMPDIDPLLRQLERERNSGRKTSGVRSLRDLWRWYFPNWTFEQSAIAQLKWADDTYPDDYLGFDLFAWNYNARWNPDYNIAEERALVKAMVQYATDRRTEHMPPPLTSIPDSVNSISPMSADLISDGFINLRNGTSRQHTVLIAVPGNARVRVWPHTGVVSDNLTWYVTEHGKFRGWMALVGNRAFSAQFREVALPPVITSTEITLTLHMTGDVEKSRIESVRNSLQTLVELIRSSNTAKIE